MEWLNNMSLEWRWAITLPFVLGSYFLVWKSQTNALKAGHYDTRFDDAQAHYRQARKVILTLSLSDRLFVFLCSVFLVSLIWDTFAPLS